MAWTLGAWSQGRSLNDQVVKNQWRGRGTGVLDKQTMRARGQSRSLDGGQIINMNCRVLGGHLKWEERSVVDAILGRGIYSGVRIQIE